MFKRDRLLPLTALIAVLAVAIGVVALLRTASINGTHALEDLQVQQVRSTANSFDARIASSFTSVGGLGARPWELTSGSAADQAALSAFAIDSQAISGFFLVDAGGSITNGVLLRPGRLGSKFDPSGWDEVMRTLASTPAVVLPVTNEAVTTELPAYAFAVAIRGKSPTSVRGAFIFEQALTADSAFNVEIRASAKGAGSTAALRFLDSNGTVVATTLSQGLGKPVPDQRVARLSPGLHRVGGDMVVAADVPTVGWHVVFTQRRSEFVEPLAGPLQTAGLVLVLLLLGVGVTLTWLLSRRLRQAREEEKRLRALHSAQDEFISVVSHELRTPVSGVLGFLQTTLDHWPAMSDEERHGAVRRAFTNARRLQAMARDVLDTESIESGQFGYLRHPINLVEEVQTAVETFAGGPVEVNLGVPDGEIVVDGDSDRLQQVLANLLDNAVKHSTGETPVEVSVERVGGTARIVVVDHGAGIDPDQLSKIFDKFVRVREGTVTGTGLGLYIARRIVEAHGGRIWAESSVGEETRFIVELPCTEQADSLATT
jgi:signal transduction histidine kinase